MYYNIMDAKSHNCLFNFILGSRGCGKSYSAKEMVVKNFQKRGKKFLYVRRYGTELKTASTYFADIVRDHEELDIAYKHGQFLLGDQQFGSSIALSKAGILKSSSFPDVDIIIFEEFIIERGIYHYLPNEVIKFLELYETIARTRDVQVFFLANPVEYSNPYFLYFDIKPPKNGEFFKKNDMLVHNVDSSEYSEFKSTTRFGKLIESTPYGDYAIHGKVLMDNSDFIMKKSRNSTPIMDILSNDKTYGVWYDRNHEVYIMSNDSTGRIKLCISVKDQVPDTFLIHGFKQMPFYQNLRKAIYASRVYYENEKIKAELKDPFKKVFTL